MLCYIMLYYGSGRKYTYDFVQEDYGVIFKDFLNDRFIGSVGVDSKGNSLVCCLESNRCFFLHLGVGIGIHPFALQSLFRISAMDILSKPDDIACQLFGKTY